MIWPLPALAEVEILFVVKLPPRCVPFAPIRRLNEACMLESGFGNSCNYLINIIFALFLPDYFGFVGVRDAAVLEGERDRIEKIFDLIREE